MIQNISTGPIFWTLHLLTQILLVIRILLRPHRDPASRVAWIVVLVSLPVVGIISYILLGETNIGLKRREKMREVISNLPQVNDTPGWEKADVNGDVPERYMHLFQVGENNKWI